MAIPDQKHYYLKLWGWKMRRAIHDCKQAYLLYSWYLEHVVWEYVRGDGRRYGRVVWRDQVTDRGCAAAISAEGTPCSERTTRRWRKTLKHLGYITWRTARNSLIIFVLESDKFPKGHERVKDALASDEGLISAAFALRDKLASDLRDVPRDGGISPSGPANLGHPTGQPWPPDRPTLAVAIREEVLYEVVNEEMPERDEPINHENEKAVQSGDGRWYAGGKCSGCGADKLMWVGPDGVVTCGRCGCLYWVTHAPSPKSENAAAPTAATSEAGAV
jgi:hypothetical protein